MRRIALSAFSLALAIGSCGDDSKPGKCMVDARRCLPNGDVAVCQADGNEMTISCQGGVCMNGSCHSHLLDPKPACQGTAPSYNAPGDTAYIVKDLKIGGVSDGFDFTGDGRPDNILAGVGALANQSLHDSFVKGDIILPVEFGPIASLTQAACVKFAFYVGNFPADQDGDGAAAGRRGVGRGTGGGDCNDHDPNIGPGHAEVPNNRVDDDCDGLADETPNPGGPDAGADIPSTDMTDMDGDGYSPATGDCNDLNPNINPRMPEICGDGLDNDCNGAADDGCDPYDGTGNEIVQVQATSLMPDLRTPKIIFDNGLISASAIGGVNPPVLDAGPSEWSLMIPITRGVLINFHITGAHVRAHIDMDAMGRMIIADGTLGGVLDAQTLGAIKGLNVSEANIHPEQSLLDVVFAGALGDLLGLRTDRMGHKLPDIDVDGDGLESFWDSNAGEAIPKIDSCKDGDGTVITNAMVPSGKCWEALDAHGTPRFLDGLSTAIKFSVVPVKLAPVPR